MLIRFLRPLAAPALVLAGLAVQQSSALGAFFVTAASGGSAAPGATYANLDLPTQSGGTVTQNGLTIAFSATGGAGIVIGTSQNQFQAPVLSGANNMFFEASTPAGPDTTAYASTGTGSATLTFGTTPQFYLGLLIGSVDSYNTLSFFSGTTLLQSFTGTQIAAFATSNSSGTLYANFTSTIAFTSVVATSTQNSFEFDNVAFGGAVPEPSSMALCSIAGVIGMVVARKRAKRAIA